MSHNSTSRLQHPATPVRPPRPRSSPSPHPHSHATEEPRQVHSIVRPVALAALAALFACSDGGTTPSGTPVIQPRTAAEALNVDLASTPDYGHPAWSGDFGPDLQQQSNAPITNPVTSRGALLGRVLFYDRHLSINGRVSCATCHQQRHAFTDTLRLSKGFNGESRTRFRTMPLLNVRYYSLGQAFWDRRARTVEDQVTQPFQDSVEMGFDAAHGGMPAMIARMDSLGYYGELFTWLYGDPQITEDRIRLALAQFVRSIVSTQSRFDSAWSDVFDLTVPDRGLSRPFPRFTAEENRGKTLFVVAQASGGGGCAACHVPPSFALVGTDINNGLDAGETRFFKAPSLRSITSSGPYMHDGRFRTLDEVLDHYTSGVQEGPALGYQLRAFTGGPQRLDFTAADRKALLAFLKTLMDESVARDAKFADPFRR